MDKKDKKKINDYQKKLYHKNKNVSVDNSLESRQVVIYHID